MLYGEKTYDNALRIINTRRRILRPKGEAHPDVSSKQRASNSGTPDLRGTPSIIGMREWLEALGHSSDDVQRLNVIHVAGTKGKGSTCAFTEAFLRTHGQRTGFPRTTGLYTSPHLVTPEERIRINMQPLSRDLFAKYAFEVFDRLPQVAADWDPPKSVVERGPRYLQFFALLAFHVFIREKVDVAILETHSGGEYDATNVVQDPRVTAVTTLGMDHVQMLGPTIENIAWHKAGIFKPGAIALSAQQDAQPQKVLERRGAEKGVAVRFVGVDPRLPTDCKALSVHVQRQNASLAIAASDALLEAVSPSRARLSEEDIAVGSHNFSWPGRFQVVREGEWTWFLDVAHNDMSVKVASEWFAKVAEELGPNDASRVLIFSHINELRDSTALLLSLAKELVAADARIDHVIFSTYDNSAEEQTSGQDDFTTQFREQWERVDSRAQLWNEPTIQGAMTRARKLGGVIFITGSQHLVGPALRMLGWDPHASKVLVDEPTI